MSAVYAYQRTDHWLAQPLTLLDPSGRGGHVRNAETLCRAVLHKAQTAAWPNIEPADYDESLATLLTEIVVQHAKFSEPHERDRRPRYEHVTLAFGPWLTLQLEWRLYDFWRRFYGRNGEKRVPVDIEGHTPEEAAALDETDDFDWDRLSPVSQRIGKRLADGHQAREIADSLGMSEDGVHQLTKGLRAELCALGLAPADGEGS